MNALTPDVWPTGYPTEYVVVDVETTGLRHSDRIVSAAAVVLDAHGTVTGRWSTLVDPQRDPGPVHIHGLTTELLTGQPLFKDIAADLAGVLSGRVLVAHNAPFDWGMLHGEFSRLDLGMPTDTRLCTMALAKLLSLPLPDFRLASLVAHYGVKQLRAHDAVDDARVTAEAFRQALHEAAAAGLALPVTVPEARPAPRRMSFPPPRTGPKQPCPYANPGKLTDRLVQGMRVAITGETSVPRLGLEARIEAGGMFIADSVSGKTSVVVTNEPHSGTGKLRKAKERGVPVIDENTFLMLLDDVAPGTLLDGCAPVAVDEEAAAARIMAAAAELLAELEG